MFEQWERGKTRLKLCGIPLGMVPPLIELMVSLAKCMQYKILLRLLYFNILFPDHFIAANFFSFPYHLF